MGNADARNRRTRWIRWVYALELGHVSRREASIIPGRRRRTGNPSLCKQRLEHNRRRERRRIWSSCEKPQHSSGWDRNTGEGREDVRNLPEASVCTSRTGGQVCHRPPSGIQNPERLRHISNLSIDLRVENPVAAANHGLMVLERVPRKGYTGSKVVLVRTERSILGVDFVPEAVVEREVRADVPGVLPIPGAKRPRVVVNGIVKSLLIKLG